MKSKHKKLIIAAAALILSAVNVFADEISVSASVDKSSLPLNEYFTYSVTVSGDSSNLPEPQLGAMPDFNKYGTRRSQNMSIINGKMSASITFSYTLAPKAAGKFSIPPAVITHKGKTYSTMPVEIEVEKAQSSQTLPNPQTTKKPAPAASGANAKQRPAESGRAFVKASVNKKNVYENEKLVYTFSFYTNVNLAANPEYAPPSFAGFWNDGSYPSNRYENIDGAQYLVNEVATTLYPLESGSKVIGPATVKIAVMDLSVPDDFDSLFSIFAGARREVKTLTSDEIKINVLPLPESGKPADFSGAVGNFTIKAYADKKEAAVNEPVTLTAEVSAVSQKGNLKSVSSVVFSQDSSFKKYDSIVSKETAQLKEFKIILVAYTPGEKEIPPVKLSFFNPDKKVYETVLTQPIKINITGEAVLGQQDLQEGGQITKIGSDINYNKNLTSVKSYCGYFVENKNFYILFIPFVLLFFVSAVYRILKNKNVKFSVYNSKKPSFNGALKYLEKASHEADKNNAEAFVAYIYKAVQEAVCAKSGVGRDKLTGAGAAEKILRESGVSDDIINKTRDIFAQMEFYRFASIKADGKAASDLKRLAQDIIGSLRK